MKSRKGISNGSLFCNIVISVSCQKTVITAEGGRSESVCHTGDGSVTLQTFILKFYTKHGLQNIPYT